VTTYQTLLNDARYILQDTVEPVRYETEQLIGILNRGLKELAKIRADAYWDLYDQNSLNVPSVVSGLPGSGEVSLTDELPLDIIFHSPLVDFIVGMAEAADDEFTVEGRAVLLLERFRMGLIGV
jgi:hypothetical protein